MRRASRRRRGPQRPDRDPADRRVRGHAEGARATQAQGRRQRVRRDPPLPARPRRQAARRAAPPGAGPHQAQGRLHRSAAARRAAQDLPAHPPRQRGSDRGGQGPRGGGQEAGARAGHRAPRPGRLRPGPPEGPREGHGLPDRGAQHERAGSDVRGAVCPPGPPLPADVGARPGRRRVDRSRDAQAHRGGSDRQQHAAHHGRAADPRGDPVRPLHPAAQRRDHRQERSPGVHLARRPADATRRDAAHGGQPQGRPAGGLQHPGQLRQDRGLAGHGRAAAPLPPRVRPRDRAPLSRALRGRAAAVDLRQRRPGESQRRQPRARQRAGRRGRHVQRQDDDGRRDGSGRQDVGGAGAARAHLQGNPHLRVGVGLVAHHRLQPRHQGEAPRRVERVQGRGRRHRGGDEGRDRRRHPRDRSPAQRVHGAHRALPDQPGRQVQEQAGRPGRDQERARPHRRRRHPAGCAAPLRRGAGPQDVQGPGRHAVEGVGRDQRQVRPDLVLVRRHGDEVPLPPTDPGRPEQAGGGAACRGAGGLHHRGGPAQELQPVLPPAVRDLPRPACRRRPARAGRRALCARRGRRADARYRFQAGDRRVGGAAGAAEHRSP